MLHVYFHLVFICKSMPMYIQSRDVLREPKENTSNAYRCTFSISVNVTNSMLF